MTDPTPDVPTPVGRPQGGMKSEDGRSAYWRMQWESAIGALADLIAEHTETVDRLEAAEGALATCAELADEHEAVMDSILPMPNREERESGRRIVKHLRAALAEVTP